MTRKSRRCAGPSAPARRGWRTETDYQVLRWDDLVKRDFSARLARPHPAARGGDGRGAARRGDAAAVPGELAVRAVRDLSLGGAAGGDRRRVPARLDRRVAAGAGAAARRNGQAGRWPRPSRSACCTLAGPRIRKAYVYHLLDGWIFSWQQAVGPRTPISTQGSSALPGMSSRRCATPTPTKS